MILFFLLCIFATSCSSPKPTPTVSAISPFKPGEVVYLKIDSTKAIIKYDLGEIDESVFLYRIVLKDNKGIHNKFVMSSELFKK